MTITVTFSTDRLNLSPDSPLQAEQVLKKWLERHGVVEEYEDETGYHWGYREIEVPQQ